jgi:hypothetical protein
MRPPPKGKAFQPTPKPIHAAKARSSEPEMDTLLKEIRAEHGAMKAVESGYRKERRTRLANAVGLGLKLAEASPKLWDDFAADRLWGNRKPKTVKQSEAVRYVVLWSYGADKRGPKQASDVWRAVEYLQGESESAADIVETNGPGIRALCDKATKKAKIALGPEVAPQEPEKAISSAAKQTPAPGNAGDRTSKSTTHRDARLSKKKAKKAPVVAAPAKGTSEGNLGVRSRLSPARSDADLLAKLRFKKNAIELTQLPKDSRVRIDAVIEKMNGGCVLRVKSCRPRPEKPKSTAAPKARPNKA